MLLMHFSCNITINPCTTDVNKCANGATCVPLQQGRYKCQCVPGWRGQLCDINIGKLTASFKMIFRKHHSVMWFTIIEFVDDCEVKPCLVGAKCNDLINDFSCDCPQGFSGKRCHIKVDMCKPNFCQNGICVDRIFYSECICNPGWTG